MITSEIKYSVEKGGEMTDELSVIKDNHGG